MGNSKASAILGIILVLVSAVVLPVHANSRGPGAIEHIAITDSLTLEFVAGAPCDWTFMVYLDGDNDLEGAGIDDFLEMSSVGSTADVNIVVQFDRVPGYDTAYGDWTDCRRFLITPGMTPSPGSEAQNIGEVNMGDPATLTTFVEWTIANYPANHYALVLWDHGSGWKGDTATKGVCWDYTSAGDRITSPELKAALAAVYAHTGVILDIVGFDACLMAMLEVGYQIKDYADIMVASEDAEPWDGWPYDPILLALTANPAMSASALATEIVNDYVASYILIETQSAVALSIGTVASATSDLARSIINAGVWGEVTTARGSVAQFYDADYIDLYHFAQLMEASSDSTVVAAATNLKNAIATAMIAEGHGILHPNAHGLSIYFPATYAFYTALYETCLDFTADTQWDEFLLKYYGQPATYELALGESLGVADSPAKDFAKLVPESLRIGDIFGRLATYERGLFEPLGIAAIFAKVLSPGAAGVPAWGWALIGIGIAAGAGITTFILFWRRRRTEEPEA